MSLSTLCRFGGWGLLAAIAFVTLAPIGLRPSLLPPLLERFGAFFVAGALFAAGYRQHLLTVSLILISSAAALELLQLLLPTRHGQLPDAGWKIAGALCGLAAGWVVNGLMRRRG